MNVLHRMGLVWIMSALTAGAASTWYVATNGVDNSDSGRGQSWALPYATISNAVRAAGNNGTVLVSNGTYVLATQISVSGVTNVLIQSADNDPNGTTVDANHQSRCFSVSSATNVVISGFRLVHGTNASAGGGMYVANTSSRVYLEFFRIERNDSGLNGAGLYFGSGSGNRIRNCLVVNNVAVGSGGGIFVGGSGGLIESCTIVSNMAAAQGGGLYGSGYNGTILNTILYSNTAGTYPNWRLPTGAPTFTNCCTTPSVAAYGSGNITTDPAFVSLSEGNYRLARGSLCIDKGLTQDWMMAARDLDGRRRLFPFEVGPVDMGCYESFAFGTLIMLK